AEDRQGDARHRHGQERGAVSGGAPQVVLFVRLTQRMEDLAVRASRWFPAALAGLFLMGSVAFAGGGKKPTKEGSSFGSLRAADPAETRKQAESWLKAVGKTDAGSLAVFKNIWEGETPLLDKVAATLSLGDEQAAKALAEARDADAAAPVLLPALL